MDAGDLSAWFGKPPTTLKVQQDGESAESAENSVGSGEEQSIPEEVEPADASDSDMEQPQSEDGERPELALGSEQDSFHGQVSRLHNGFIIDIPKIPNKDDYEHLPGHFTVDRVLSEHPRDKYLVKLASGEIELVRIPKFPIFHSCPSHTFHFHFL
jgi:hypothetical protein